MNIDDKSFDIFCITIDVDWASDEIMADILRIMNERNIKATFFCTHPGIEVSDHERAIHPNYRRNGDSLLKLRNEVGGKFETLNEGDVYRYVVELTRSFCPEAVGVRAHSLIYDSQLLPIYQEFGLQYESNYLLPLTEGLHPVWKEYDIVEIPIYFNDHFELKSGATGFHIEELSLERPGLKVFQFHPNMVFINASTNGQYLDCKPYYQDYDALIKRRNPGRGARTLFLELLDLVADKGIPTATLAEVNTYWRKANPLKAKYVAGL